MLASRQYGPGPYQGAPLQPHWPRLSVIPNAMSDVSGDLARLVRQSVGASAMAALDLSAVAKAGGFRPRRGDLGAGEGGREALLLPAARDRFDIVVDPTPRGGWAASEDPCGRTATYRVRFRVAHEIGHSFFYERSAGLPRRVSRPGSAAEESFCDRFAQDLLVPPDVFERVTTAEDVFTIADRCAVSVEVAARAFACSPSLPRVAVLYWPRPDSIVRQVEIQWASDPRIGSRSLEAARQHTNLCAADYGGSVSVRPDRRQVVVLDSR
jgi:hypothetical protein